MSDRPEPTLTGTAEGRRALRWVRALAVFAAVYVVVVVTVLAGLLSVELRRVSDAATDRQVVEHRIRNEAHHDAICRVLRHLERADPSGVECPPRLAEGELRP